MLPKFKKLKGSKDGKQLAKIVAKHIVSLDKVEDGDKKTKTTKYTRMRMMTKKQRW